MVLIVSTGVIVAALVFLLVNRLSPSRSSSAALVVPTPLAGFLTPVSLAFVTLATPTGLAMPTVAPHALTALDATATAEAPQPTPAPVSPADAARQKDFIALFDQLRRIELSCYNPSSTVIPLLQALRKAGSDVGPVERGAAVAHDACAAAKTSFAAVVIPASLSDLHLDQPVFLLTSWAEVWTLSWQDAGEVLRGAPNGVSDADFKLMEADFKLMGQELNDYSTRASLELQEVAAALHVPYTPGSASP
jgi:hypothetical protein